MLQNDQALFPPTMVTLKDERMVTLRFLTLNDAEKLGDFYLSIERAAYRFYCPHPLNRAQANKKAAAALDPTSIVLVAENDVQHIVGYGSVQWQDGVDKPSTLGICIQRAYRGIGLGEVLMVHLIRVAEKIAPSIVSLTVQKVNPRAIALYSKMGFQVVREQMRAQVEEFPPEPEYYMERQVQS